MEKQRKETVKELENFGEVPNLPKLLTEDATPEKLVSLLADQRGRMLVASAEGTVLEIAKGRYSKAANFEVFLKGHAGDTLIVDRQGRPSEYVEKPALSLALAVQPDVLAGVAAVAAMKERGFLARFLYALPPSPLGQRKVHADPVPSEVRAKYRMQMRRLWELGSDTNSRGSATMKGDPSGEVSRDETFVCDPPPAA